MNSGCHWPLEGLAPLTTAANGNDKKAGACQLAKEQDNRSLYAPKELAVISLRPLPYWKRTLREYVPCASDKPC